MTEPIRIGREGPVLVVEIDRPARRNAIDRDAAERLATAFRDFEFADDAEVAVLTGAGEHFCAGADLVAAATAAPNRLDPSGDGPMGPTRMSLSKPVVAAVEGYCVAGGLELALWCDLRIASETAVFGVFSRRFGVPLVDGGTVRLPRLIGASRAMDLILTGRALEARVAAEWGLANRLVGPGQARAEAIALAREIARHPQTCLRADLVSARSAFEGSVRDLMVAELARGLPAFEAEGRHGAREFTEGAGRHGGRVESETE